MKNFWAGGKSFAGHNSSKNSGKSNSLRQFGFLSLSNRSEMERAAKESTTSQGQVGLGPESGRPERAP